MDNNNRKVLITETILRDAHQSQAATRMTMEQMLPMLEQLLGYKHYADDVVDKFVKASIENGVKIIRVFDALNDTRNLETAMKAIKKYGGICEATICYTTSPVHTNEYFVKLAKELEQMGADNICLKDMANLLLPYTTYDLVKALKAELKPTTKIHLHTHNTTGTGDMVNLKAIEAGCDIVDTALSALGNGTSQPATEPLVATLRGTKYDTGIDLEKLIPITDHFKKVAEELEKSGALNPNVRKINVNTLKYQVPGGMLSNLMKQLKEAGKLDKLDEVLA